jgi:hypothetical protein
MIGPPLHIGIGHLPAGLLVATPLLVCITGVGIAPTLIWMVFILLLSMHLNMQQLYQPERYQLESLAASPFVEVCVLSLSLRRGVHSGEVLLFEQLY